MPFWRWHFAAFRPISIATICFTILLNLRCSSLCWANYSTPPPAMPSKYLKISPTSPPSPLPSPPIFPLANGPPIRMQFTIEWTNLTQFFLGQHQQANSTLGQWGWRKTKAEGRTGSEEEDSAAGDLDLEEIFPGSKRQAANQNQQQMTVKPTPLPSKNATKPSISAVVAVNIVPQKNGSNNQPGKLGQKLVMPSMGTTKMPTTMPTMGATKTTAKMPSTQTTKELALAQLKTTMLTSKKSQMPSSPFSTKMTTTTTHKSPNSASTSATIPPPIRLRFLLTRRIRPLMLMRKAPPPPHSSSIPPSSSSTSTTPKLMRPPSYSVAPANLMPPTKSAAGRLVVLHDIDPGKKSPPAPIQNAPVHAPGEAPKPPGTQTQLMPRPIAVESRKYLPIPSVNVNAAGPTNRPNKEGGNNNVGCQRREIDGDTRRMANDEGAIMGETGGGGGGGSRNCGSILTINHHQQMPPQPMPLAAAPSMNGILTPQQEMTFKLAVAAPMNGAVNSGCSCRPQSLAQSFGFRPIPNKCCRRPKCFDCPTAGDQQQQQSTISPSPLPIPIDSSIVSTITLAPIVLPMPTIWENPNKNKNDGGKHKALGLS